MEKLRLILLLVALSVTACNRDNTVEPDSSPESGTLAYDPSQVVCFTAIPDPSDLDQTRGTPITNVSQMTDIGVFAAYTALTDWNSTTPIDMLLNTRLQRRSIDGAWTYTDGTLPKWKTGSTITADHRYTFFGYAPYATTTNGLTVTPGKTTGIPELSYTVPTDCTKQPDLMVSIPRYNVRKTPSAVALEMKHALTSVGFQIASSTGDQKITTISIKGVKMSGTLNIEAPINTNAAGVVTSTPVVWNTTGAVNTTTNFTSSINFDPNQQYFTAKATMSTNLMKGDGYLMMIPQALDANAKLIITFQGGTTREFPLTGREWIAGKKVTYQITLNPDVNVDDIIADFKNKSMPPLSNRSYVGAFWKRDQTGERLMHFLDVGTNNIPNQGPWSASVVWMDGRWQQGDIMLTTTGRPLADVIANPGDAENYQVTDGKAVVTGTTTGTGSTKDIFFRIGLKTKYTPTTAYPARYAIVALQYGTPKKNHLIFIRQGETPDKLLSTSSEKWSVYNMTVESEAPSANVQPNAGEFTKFPSQGGRMFQWNHLTAYHPVKSIPNYVKDVTLLQWTNAREVCPTGSSTPTELQFRSSITSQITSGKTAAGYYADGFYDRRQKIANDVTAAPNSGNEDTGNSGVLVFDPTTRASLFWPAAGVRDNGINFDNSRIAKLGVYWTKSLVLNPAPSKFYFCHVFTMDGLATVGPLYPTERVHGISNRCVFP